MTVTLAQLTRRAATAEANVHALLPGTRRLIAIASGKGGVGKTWFAATLAQSLARRGRNVLLFDGDLGLANVDIQLGLLPQHDLSAVFAGVSQLREVVTPYAGEGLAQGFDVIAGRSGAASLGRLQPAALAQLRDDLARLAMAYDHVILDLAAGVDTAVTTLADHGGLIYVVATPDPTSLTDAYAFIKLLHQRRQGCDVRVIINMAQDRGEGARTYDTLLRTTEHFLKISPPLAGIIRRDKNVVAAIRQQTPMLARFSASPAAEDVAAIADKLLL